MSEASSFQLLATCLHLSMTDTGGLEPTASNILHSFWYKERYGPHRAEVGLTTDYTDLHEWAGQGECQSCCSKALLVCFLRSFLSLQCGLAIHLPVIFPTKHT